MTEADGRAASHAAASSSAAAAAPAAAGKKAPRGRGRGSGSSSSSSRKQDGKAAEQQQQQQQQQEEEGAAAGADAAAATAAAAPLRKRRKVAVALTPALRAAWRRFASDLSAAERAAAAAEGGFAFAFVEGALVTALREGWWLLLDEVNLAPPEVLERVAGVLEAASAPPPADGAAPAPSGLLLVERGDAAAVPRHPGFRLVAAMNPATDAGKRDLPARLRARFTELWVAEPSQRADLAALVAGYLAGAAPSPPVDAVVDFYVAAKREAVSARFCAVPCFALGGCREGAVAQGMASAR